jgi:hypothetical protein
VRKILGVILLTVLLAILLFRFLPFIPLNVRFDWVMNLGLALMFLTGATAVIVVKNILLRILIGGVTFAVLFAILQTLISSLL